MKYILLFLFIVCCVLSLPYKRLLWIKRSLVAIAAAVAVGLSAYAIAPQVISSTETTEISVTALNKKNDMAQGSEIWIKGVSIDGRWYPAKQVFSDTGKWVEKDGSLGWRAFEQPDGMAPVINGKVPAGEKRVLVFEANRWHGFAEVNQGSGSQLLDTYLEVDSQDLGASLEPYVPSHSAAVIAAASIAAGILTFLLVWVLFLKIPKKEKEECSRFLWADILRVVCIFTVVWLHCTNQTFDWSFNEDRSAWYNYLYVNSFTSFAVPCFFMLCGALLLQKNVSIKKTLTHRVPQALFPLIFWSGIYILLKRFYWQEEIGLVNSLIKSLFTSQYNHLWFMYPLIGLYFLLPFLSKAYYELSRNMKIYAAVLIVAVPMTFLTISQLLGINSFSIWFSFGFPELGLFVLGKWLCDFLARRKKVPWRYPALGAALPFAMVVLSTYLISLKKGMPDKAFISPSGAIPVFCFAVSIFILLCSQEENLQARVPIWLKRKIHVLSELSMGIYFVHMLVLALVGNRQFLGFGFTNNEGSLWNMFAGAVLYFSVSAMICYIGAHIPVVGSFFGIVTSRELRDGEPKFYCSIKKYCTELIERSAKSGLNGWRGILSILIALFHFNMYFPFQSNYFGTAYLGVEFFFVLSGFLLVESVLKSKSGISRQIAKKAFRLYPLYLVGLFLVILVHALQWKNGNIFSVIAENKIFWSELFMLQMSGIQGFEMINFPAWYVSVLFILSVAFIIMIKFAKNLCIYIVAPLLSFFSYYFLYVNYSTLNLNAGYAGVLSLGIIRGLGGLGLGVFLYGLYVKIRPCVLKLNQLIIHVLELLASAGLLLFLFKQQGFRSDYGVLLPICVLIVIMFERSGIVSKILTAPLFLLFGSLSYAFYLLQSATSIFMSYFVPNFQQPFVSVLYLIVNLFLALLASYATDRYVQSKFKSI